MHELKASALHHLERTASSSPLKHLMPDKCVTYLLG